MVEIKSINSFAKGFTVNYTVMSPCGCSSIREVLFMDQKKKPTQKQALEAIQNEIRNKG